MHRRCCERRRRRAVAARWVQAVKCVFDAASFAELPDISIDYAVMEKAANVAVIPCAFGWSDIGSWKAVAETRETDEEGNSTEGDTILVNSRRTYLRSENRLVAAVGVEDLVVIDTPDAVLVAHKDSSQQVKDIVAKLKRDGHVTAKEHLTVHRPWGKYTVLHEAPQFKVKRIEVNPGKKLSLQMHHKRSEHWVVVQGTARITVGDTIANWHRTNPFMFRCKSSIGSRTSRRSLDDRRGSMRRLSGRRRHREIRRRVWKIGSTALR